MYLDQYININNIKYLREWSSTWHVWLIYTSSTFDWGHATERAEECSRIVVQVALVRRVGICDVQ